MLNSIHQDITKEQMDALRQSFDEQTIPYSLGVFAGSGSKYRSLRYTSGDINVNVHILPDLPTHTVQQEPVLLNSYAVVVDNSDNKAGLIAEDEYDNLDFLPELRQAFHEGESFNDREADYRYHFPDGSTEIAVHASNPVDRLDDPITIKSIEFLGGFAPRKWLLETTDGEGLYLRERSGSIRLYDEVDGGDEIFNAYIGREHPGTPLNIDRQSEEEYNVEDDEILGIITSVNYINVVENPSTEVSEEIQERYHQSVAESFEQFSNTDVEELYEDMDDELFISDEE